MITTNIITTDIIREFNILFPNTLALLNPFNFLIAIVLYSFLMYNRLAAQ